MAARLATRAASAEGTGVANAGISQQAMAEAMVSYDATTSIRNASDREKFMASLAGAFSFPHAPYSSRLPMGGMLDAPPLSTAVAEFPYNQRARSL